MELNFDDNEINIIRAAVAQLHVLYVIEDVLTVDPIKKAKVFVQGYRILQSASLSISIKYNKTRNKLVKIIEELSDKNNSLIILLEEYNKLYFGRDRILKKIIKEVNSLEISMFIDFFILLIQRKAYLNPEAVKGFSLDGKSGELVKEYLGKPKEEELEGELEEELVEEELPTIKENEIENEEEKEELKEDIEEEAEEI